MTTTKKNAWHRNHLIRDAIGLALYNRMKADSSVHLFGEGAHMKVRFDAPPINDEYLDRVHTLPISEDGNTNFAVGAMLAGVKPVVDIITADFTYRAFDAICNTAAKVISGWTDSSLHTMVVRAEFLTAGPTTGQRPEALFAHIPGIKVMLPSTPKDAYSLMTYALTTPGLTVFFEDREVRDDETAESDLLRVDELPRTVTHAGLRNAPAHPTLTVVTYARSRQLVERVVHEEFADRVEVIDMPLLKPLPLNVVFASVQRTGSLLFVEPDVEAGGIGAEVVAQVAQHRPNVRVRRLGGLDVAISASAALHHEPFPTGRDIADVIRVMA